MHADQMMEKLTLQIKQRKTYDKVLFRLKIGSTENVFVNFIIITFLTMILIYFVLLAIYLLPSL